MKITADNKGRHGMKMVDLSHMMNVHTPGWVGYAGLTRTARRG